MAQDAQHGVRITTPCVASCKDGQDAAAVDGLPSLLLISSNHPNRIKIGKDEVVPSLKIPVSMSES